MRWLSFFILAYLALGLEAGLARAIEWQNAAPNFVLIALVFIALGAPRDAALLGCFILGALHDFASQGTLGLLAFTYGLCGAMIVSLQSAVNRKHPLTHFIFALLAGLLAATILALHGWIRPPLEQLGRAPIWPLFSSAVYSAVIAPPLIFGLQKMSKVFRFQSSRRRM